MAFCFEVLTSLTCRREPVAFHLFAPEHSDLADKLTQGEPVRLIPRKDRLDDIGDKKSQPRHSSHVMSVYLKRLCCLNYRALPALIK
jgi:hypothetical protein